MLIPLAKPILRCICFLVAFLFLTGCWSKEEFNDRAFVTLMTVDRTKDGQTELSMGFFLPNRLAPGQGQPMSKEKPFAMVNRTGRDLAEAFHNIQKDLPRKVTWGALRVIILGESFAEHGLQPLLDFVLRVTDIRMKTFVFQLSGKARTIGSITPIFERFPSEIIREFSHMELLPSATIKDIMYAQYNHGDTFIPQLELSLKKMDSENQKVGNWLGTKGAVLVRNGKQIAECTPVQARGIQWISKKVKNMILTFPSPTDGKPISVRIAQLKEKHSVKQINSRIAVQIQVKVTGDLISTESTADLSDVTMISKMEQAASQQIKSEITGALKLTVTNKADIFQIGNQINWRYPKLWSQIKGDWRDYYAEHTDFRVEAQTKLQRLGGIKQHVVEEEEEEENE